MLDIKLIRRDPELVKAGARKKRIKVDIDRILELDEASRERQTRIDALRSEQKSAGKLIAKASPDERAKLVEEQTALKGELKALEDVEATCRAEIDALMLLVPNVPADEVPEGESDVDNVEVARWGEPRAFEFEPWDHVALATVQGWLDIEAAGRISGSRNYILFGDLSLLEGAVMRYALDHMVAKGFVPVSVPTLVRTATMVGTGYFPGGEEQAYRCDERDDLCLVGTAEVPVTALHAGEILDLATLPRKYVALSSCYRREAGTYGRDTRGLYRVHQFLKVEQVVVDVAEPERSVEHHRAILSNSEEVCRAFELPYRVVNVCGGDLGQPQVQKFDIECWMPSREGGARPTAPRASDFQARRLDLRYRDEEESAALLHAEQHRRREHADAHRAAREPPDGGRSSARAGSAALLPRRSRVPRAPGSLNRAPIRARSPSASASRRAGARTPANGCAQPPPPPPAAPCSRSVNEPKSVFVLPLPPPNGLAPLPSSWTSTWPFPPGPPDPLNRSSVARSSPSLVLPSPSSEGGKTLGTFGTGSMSNAVSWKSPKR
ncbi:MAG: serine--tRNA ligase [Planctomycetota bacterium]